MTATEKHKDPVHRDESETAPADDEADLEVLLQRIEVRKSEIHGLGLFATKPILKGQFIIEYLGEMISKKEGDRRSALHPFVFILDDDWDIDGNIEYNLAKYINHSCAPNSEFQVLPHRSETKKNAESNLSSPQPPPFPPPPPPPLRVEKSVWIRAIKDIDIGEEILYDYHFDSAERHPCHCGAPNCKRWMNEVNEDEGADQEKGGDDGREEENVEDDVGDEDDEDDVGDDDGDEDDDGDDDDGDEDEDENQEEAEEKDDPDMARVTTMTAEEIYDKLKELGMIRTDLKVKRTK